MVITLGKAGAWTSVIQNLLDIQQTLSPGYNIDWDTDKLMRQSEIRGYAIRYLDNVAKSFLSGPAGVIYTNKLTW